MFGIKKKNKRETGSKECGNCELDILVLTGYAKATYELCTDLQVRMDELSDRLDGNSKQERHNNVSELKDLIKKIGA